MVALSAGLNLLKFFPAGIFGGAKALKALSAPFGGVSFVPTGGINEANLREYLELPCVFAVGGSWMFEPNDFDSIKSSAARAAEIVREQARK
jgi:2-dehydro-3-deoxyphosphogluconate aldolase/(4S)-4-hydroxy-2-oxoglutarate aldolase